MTDAGAARAARKPHSPDDGTGDARPPLIVDPAGEITLRTPSPARVWALSAFTEPVDLSLESHYRLTQEAVGAALASGVEQEQIVTFLERSSGEPLPSELAARLTDWVRAQKRIGLRRAILLTLDDPVECESLLASLRERGWRAEPHGAHALLVPLETGDAESALEEERLLADLREEGHAPRWLSTAGADDATSRRERVAPATTGPASGES